MSTSILAVLAALAVATMVGSTVWVFTRRGSPVSGGFRGQSGATSATGSGFMNSRPASGARSSAAAARESGDEQVNSARRSRVKKKKKQPKITLEEKLFRAGIFSDQHRADFKRLQALMPPICAAIGAGLGWFSLGGSWIVIGLVFGAFIGLQVPNSYLDRKIVSRGEDIMFYLPLVIEQIAIGVSSSLDIGPCIQRVSAMADERNSHNPVTELIRHAQYYVKSGVSLDDALTEVGKLSGHNELKHCFGSLAQVSRHGGELSKQLQELADAVGQMRETRVEERIKKLELVATGPVALVFCGFLIIIVIGFGMEIMKAF